MKDSAILKFLTGKFGGRYELASSKCPLRTNCPRCPAEERLQPQRYRHRHIIRIKEAKAV